MAKQLKKWNGRGHGIHSRKHIYVAAYTQKQAKDLIEQACKTYLPANEIRVYYNPDTWGYIMDGVEPTEPCVYVGEKWGKTKPERVL